MPTPLDPPLVIPAVAERTFDMWFFTDFSVNGITPTEGVLRFTKVPMNSATGDTYPEAAVGIQCNVWEVVQALPASAGAAMQAVVSALPLIEEWVNSNSNE